jgi:uncharacterized protein
MLQHTFCHLPNIGTKREHALWQDNIRSWQDLLTLISGDAASAGKGRSRFRKLPFHVKDDLAASLHHLENNNAAWFSEKLKSADTWRMFPDFRHLTTYLDIETTGLESPDITTIALYDGRQIRYYVNGDNLDQFQDDILDYGLLVTFNGKTFDVPIIEKFFNIKLHQAHIDLRYVLKSLGYAGGLKRCEKNMGIDRGDLDGVDGFFAVRLWSEYCRTRNVKVLETLLAYNIEDVVNLENLMIQAYNMKIQTLFPLAVAPLPESLPPVLPFSPDRETIDRLKYGAGYPF